MGIKRPAFTKSSQKPVSSIDLSVFLCPNALLVRDTSGHWHRSYRLLFVYTLQLHKPRNGPRRENALMPLHDGV